MLMNNWLTYQCQMTNLSKKQAQNMCQHNKKTFVYQESGIPDKYAKQEAWTMLQQ